MQGHRRVQGAWPLPQGASLVGDRKQCGGSGDVTRETGSGLSAHCPKGMADGDGVGCPCRAADSCCCFRSTKCRAALRVTCWSRLDLLPWILDRGSGRRVLGAVGSPLRTYRRPSVLRICDSTNQGQGDPVVVTVGKTHVLADPHHADPCSRVSSNLTE